jgi:hypothetical protein
VSDTDPETTLADTERKRILARADQQHAVGETLRRRQALVIDRALRQRQALIDLCYELIDDVSEGGAEGERWLAKLEAAKVAGE